MSRRCFAAAGLALVLVAVGGCSTVTDVRKVLFTPRLRQCKGFDVPLSAFIGPSRKELRAKVVARNVDHDVPFVVETTADSFVLVGFTPLGTKAFTLERRGDDLDEVEVKSFLGPGLTVPPTNFMEDVLAMSMPSACGTSASEVGVKRFDDWEVRDTCSGGRLVVRNLYPLENEGEGEEEGEEEVVEEAAGQTAVDGAGQTTVTAPGVAGQAPEAVLEGAAPVPAGPPPVDEAADATVDATGEEAQSDEGSEVEVTYGEDGVIVYQKRCRYRARYVLEATPLEVDAEEAAQVPADAPAAAPAQQPVAPATPPAEAPAKVSGEAAE